MNGLGEMVPIPKNQYSDAVFPTCTNLGHALETRDSHSWLYSLVGVADIVVGIKINITRLDYIFSIIYTIIFSWFGDDGNNNRTMGKGSMS